MKNEADYEQALQRVEELWGAEPGSTQGDELDVLVALIEAYEREHYSQLRNPGQRRLRTFTSKPPPFRN